MHEIEYLDLVDENDYDGNLNYDKQGIKEIFYMTKEEVSELVNNNPEKFKGDYPKFFKWLLHNNIL